MVKIQAVTESTSGHSKARVIATAERPPIDSKTWVPQRYRME